jgi:transcriptional regulator with XRE-family HTH domain
MFDHARFAKVLALAGSDADGEALAALRKARDMLRAADLSFTHVAQTFAAGTVRDTTETQYLRQHLATAERFNRMLQSRIDALERQLGALRSRRCKGSPSPKSQSLKRSRAEIAAAMRAIFDDPLSYFLSDREIARRTGLSPQTVGNWRRKLDAEPLPEASTVHYGRRRR